MVESPALPNLGEQAMTELSVGYLGVTAGAVASGSFEPVGYRSNGEGLAIVEFDPIRTRTAVGVFGIYWNGDLLAVFDSPNAESRVLGFVYDVEVIPGSDGTIGITISVERQRWYCGFRIGDCYVTTADHWFKPYECIGGHYYKEAGKSLVCVPNE